MFRNVGLTEELRGRLDDLRAAQKRLVAAQDERTPPARAQHPRRRPAAARRARGEAPAGRAARRTRSGAGRDDARRARRPRRPRRSRTCGTSRAGSTRRCWPTEGLAAALEAQARKASLPVRVRRGRRLAAIPQEIEAAIVLLRASRRSRTSRSTRRRRGPPSRSRTAPARCGSRSPTTVAGSILRRRATAPACRGSRTGSRRSTARCRSPAPWARAPRSPARSRSLRRPVPRDPRSLARSDRREAQP